MFKSVKVNILQLMAYKMCLCLHGLDPVLPGFDGSLQLQFHSLLFIEAKHTT